MIRIVSFILDNLSRLFGISFIGIRVEPSTWDSWNSCGVLTSRRKKSSEFFSGLWIVGSGFEVFISI